VGILQNPDLEMVSAETEHSPEPKIDDSSALDELRPHAVELARRLAWLPGTRSSSSFDERYRKLQRALKPIFRALQAATITENSSDDFRWLYDNLRLLDNELQGICDSLPRLRKLPHVRTPNGNISPRVAAIAEGFLDATHCQFSAPAFTNYIRTFQESTALEMAEVWAMVAALKLSLLEEIAVRGQKIIAERESSFGVGTCIHSLRETSHLPWKTLLEPLILFDSVLREDPAGAYPKMDYESRELYRNKLAKIAQHSDYTEAEVAATVLRLAKRAAQEGYSDPRVALRRSHVGFYLVDRGAELLHEQVGFRPSFAQRITSFLRNHPDEFYLPGIQVLTFGIMSAIVLLLTNTFTSPVLILFSMLLLFLPSSQSAVQLMNYLTTSLLKAEILPKLDFSEGITSDCLTLVAVPSLLLNKEQVCRLVDNLEVRFLGNHHRNIHFALLTDLPDSHELPREDNPLVDFCARLIRDLNEKYAGQEMGSFLLFHRHRLYNPREGVWMGWERKRGKLMDLNKLLRSQYDSFPVKVGDLSILPQVRFVITLDSDTELPRGSARRMIGALAHPLNQAVIDPEKNIVIAGYAILQPRVGVSVQSAASSRLAGIYSGETGFDIYTRAVSDVYQDLYGEGIFTGKGIYEVDTVHRVLDRRFPRNALLSHDLIEGAYARAGLASDIEIIEDYPSRYSAYNRRKHRWLRGDWQITSWLSSQVPDESGKLVPNPISLVSQWKILDNLRRSLVEPATLLLFVLGWLVLPGKPQYWTLAAIAILFVPSWFQFLFTLIRAIAEKKSSMAREAVTALFTANVNIFFTLIFLAHQTLLSLDAVVRTLIRRLVTQRRLLEWETAAEAELGLHRRTPVETYLYWMPMIALGLGVLLWFGRRHAFAAGLPILLLWASSKLVSSWLNSPPRAQRKDVSEKDEAFLRRTALRTWRYFAEFCTEEHNWLIPDNVQEQPTHPEHPLVIAPRISPTNLGFLLNARQVACEFGFLTTPEFAEQTLRTLTTISRLRRHNGHLFNWYNTQTLEPLSPLFVSSVDSGNLVASLWTLQQGCLDLLRRPLFESSLGQGLVDHLRTLVGFRAFSSRRFKSVQSQMNKKNWLSALLNPTDEALVSPHPGVSKSKHDSDVQWFVAQARARLRNIRRQAQLFSPWLLPEFVSLGRDPAIHLNFDPKALPLQRVPEFIDTLATRLQFAMSHSNGSGDRHATYQWLAVMLPEARAHATRLIEDLRRIASLAAKLSDEMDFRFLYDRYRRLLSIGFDIGNNQLHSACYDLLASESRTSAFVAIAKEDIPQETWFQLGRSHTRERGIKVLLSWTGTMFEYLMPTVWMRTYPNTLLERSHSAAVRLHQAYTAGKGIPWGISESAYAKIDSAGNYQYHAFGLPWIALHKPEFKALVISPYSTLLALPIDAAGAMQNLRTMARQGWFGPYGFYEAADFTDSRALSWRRRYELVRCWMAHHQGMSLLSLANFLHDGVVQRWFHNDRRVQATELLLHEKPATQVRPLRKLYKTAA
jgi:cyclic beta-1,2-glucan synthetase